MIAAYLAELSGALSFDRELARRVAREVEDHLREAVATGSLEDRAEAERRAVASFGDPRALAVQFAAVSLMRRTRRVGVAVVLAIVAVLAAMKVRVAWYAVANWTLSEDARRLAGAVLAIDRLAFWFSIIVGLIALFYIGCRRGSAVLQADDCRESRRAVFLCAVAGFSLVVSVISDGVLTALQFASESREAAAIPLLSMAVEIACAGAVTVLIFDAIRRAARTDALLRTQAAPARSSFSSSR
ncbi:MAG: hypothetical protein WDO17_06530 [Alphaproteobacteria bacterium]